MQVEQYAAYRAAWRTLGRPEPGLRGGAERVGRVVVAAGLAVGGDQPCQSSRSSFHFANNEIAERLFPLGRNVPIVLDPERSFGEPTASGGVRTDVLAQLVDAGEAPERLAEIYALPVSDIQHAVQFEHDRTDESPAA